MDSNYNNIFYITTAAVIFSIIAIVCFKKSKGILGRVLIAFNAINALACAYFASIGEYNLPTIKFWALLYFIVVSCIFISPLLTSENDLSSRITVTNYSRMNRLCDFYIIVTIIYSLFMIEKVIGVLRSGMWLSQYINMRGEDAVYYDNLFEQIIINCTTYLQLPVLLYVFYTFAYNIDYKRKIIAILCPIVNTLIGGIYTSSRTDFFVIVVLYFVIYIIFSDKLSKNVKRYIYIVFGTAVVLGLSVSLAITSSRFGADDNSWISSYLGHSFVVGHDMIAYTVKFSYGTSFGKQLLELFGIQRVPYKCLIDNGFAFTPVVGYRYADFGFIGLLVYSGIVALIFKKFVNQNSVKIGTAYIVMYYFRDMFIGCLYYNATAYSWLIVIVISIFINKFIDK